MAGKTTIVCLANSRKHLHRCIAGIELHSPNANRWVRPIGDRSGHGLSEREIALGDGVQPRTLDVIEIGLAGWRPSGHQQENYVLDASIPWRRVGRCAWPQATALPMSSESLWVGGSHTYNGINNYVPETQAVGLTDSLRLVRSRVTIRVLSPYITSKPLEVWAKFLHAGFVYQLKVTDTFAEDKFRSWGVGDYRLGDSILTISLGEKWEGQFHKLVAAVIENPAV